MRALLLASAVLLLGGGPARAGQEPILKQDWIVSDEPTHEGYWGVEWGYNNLFLPSRGLQRGKRELESRLIDNYRFENKTLPWRIFGGVVRASSSQWESALLTSRGALNHHHVLGHDAFARAAALDDRDFLQTSHRISQLLPRMLGGSELESSERPTNFTMSASADYTTMANAAAFEGELHLGYLAGKDILGGPTNSLQALNFLILRQRYHEMESRETGDLTPAFAASCGTCAFTGGNTDFMAYLRDLNKGRYGASSLDQYRLKMSDIHRAYTLQLLDPLLWVSATAYIKDYVVLGKNRTQIPMIPLGRGIGYLPSLRTYFSYFGIEYFQDNYFRRKGVLANLYWTRGDNRFEKRFGLGLDVENIPLGRHARAGFFTAFHRQPTIDMHRTRPLSAGELGTRRDVYKLGGWLKFPLWYSAVEEDPWGAFVYVRAGIKNRGWLPGEYLAGRGFAQVGLGLHL